MSEQTRREFLRSAGAAAVLGTLGSAVPLDATPDGEGKPDRPNILFFYPDQHRSDWCSQNPALGLKTPNLDKLAERGVRFTNALTPSPLCAPARACLAAGLEYDRCRVRNNSDDYPLDLVSFYTLLRDSGYHVMGCGKFDLNKGENIWGLDGKYHLREWGFSDGINNAGKQAAYRSGAQTPGDPYMALLEKKGLREAFIKDYDERRKIGNTAAFASPIPDEYYCDNWVARNGLELIRNAPKGKPWFIQVNFVGPHPPWDATESMLSVYKDASFPQPNGNTQHKPEEHVQVRRNYSAMITNIDRWLGVYVDELAKRGELDNTVIVYSSDHGEMLGDHNLWSKSKPYQPSAGVPLIAAGPGVQKGKVISAPVTTLDLTATFLDFAGVKRPETMDSRSLQPVLSGKADGNREVVFSGLNAWRLAFDGRYKLITGFGAGGANTILFDLEKDPLENTNIAEANPNVVERLSKLLKRL